MEFGSVFFEKMELSLQRTEQPFLLRLNVEDKYGIVGAINIR